MEMPQVQAGFLLLSWQEPDPELPVSRPRSSWPRIRSRHFVRTRCGHRASQRCSLRAARALSKSHRKSERNLRSARQWLGLLSGGGAGRGDGQPGCLGAGKVDCVGASQGVADGELAGALLHGTFQPVAEVRSKVGDGDVHTISVQGRVSADVR